MSNVTLHLGDCLEYMKTMPDKSVDAVITDPPYGVGYEYNNLVDSAENLQKIIDGFIPPSIAISKRVAAFTGVKNIGMYKGADWFYSWVVPAGSGVSAFGFTCWTPIAFFGKDAYSGNGSRPDCFVDYKPKREGHDHPCEKPLSVMRWAVERFSKPGETIFDPFMGSGTTGVAAVQLGRNFIGCEIDPKYFAIAEKRIKQAQLQEPLF